MKIAESYFQELIHSDNAIEALTTLSQLWSTHMDEAKDNFNLSEPEYLVHLCQIYTGEVGNGGHVQFFLNRGRDITERVLQALSALGLVELEKCLRAALTVFPGGEMPAEWSALEATVETFSDPQNKKLDQLDKKVWKEPMVDEFLLAYLRKRRDDVLVEERATRQSEDFQPR